MVGGVVRLVNKGEFAVRDRFMRANLDAMAHRVGDMQARLVPLDSLGERVLGLAGLAPNDMHRADGRGGALVGARPLTWTNCKPRSVIWIASLPSAWIS